MYNSDFVTAVNYCYVVASIILLALSLWYWRKGARYANNHRGNWGVFASHIATCIMLLLMLLLILCLIHWVCDNDDVYIKQHFYGD